MINETVNFTLQDFRIKTRSIANYTMSTHHFHDVYEIYFLNDGTRNYFINDTTHIVCAGNLVLIKPYDLHKTIDTGVSHSRVLINFNQDFLPFKDIKAILDICFSTSSVMTLDFAMQNHIEEMIKLMVIEANTENLYVQTKLQSQLINLLIDITGYMKLNNKADAKIAPANQKIYEIIQYLKTNYSKNLTLNELSKEFFISQYYMARVFKKTTGFTIFEYIHSLRIIEAQHLLKETSLKIIDVAQAVGFHNISNFGKVFKSLTTISPSNYRKMHK